MKPIVTFCAAMILVASVSPAAAQTAAGGARSGQATGNAVAGPVGGAVGGIVGGVVGGVTGGVASVLGVEQRPRFREYVVREHPTSYTYDQDLVVGTTLPESGVTYYDVPAEYNARGAHYTMINGRIVLVEPSRAG